MSHFINFSNKIKKLNFVNIDNKIIDDYEKITNQKNITKDQLIEEFKKNYNLVFACKYFGKLIDKNSVFTHHLRPGQMFKYGIFTGPDSSDLQKKYNQEIKDYNTKNQDLTKELNLILEFMSNVVNDPLLAPIFNKMYENKSINTKIKSHDFIEKYLIKGDYDIIGLQEINHDLYENINNIIKPKYENYNFYLGEKPDGEKTTGGLIIKKK
jgi:hypothetical protein